MNKIKEKTYILSACAIGPNADTVSVERKVLEDDPEPKDLHNIINNMTTHDLRRVGHFSELSVIGAQKAVSRMAQQLSPDTGLYFSTGLGEVKKTVPMFEQVIRHKESFISPYSFVNSVNNSTPFYVAKTAGLESINTTISQEEHSFETALRLAQSDIEDGIVESALTGGTDENAFPKSEHMNRIALNEDQVMGEGGGWLCLSKKINNAFGELLIVKEFTFDKLSDWLDNVAGLVTSLTAKNEHVYLMPGFRLDKKHISELLKLLPVAKTINYLQYCGCFHTAAAFGVASIFDDIPAHQSLYFHINNNLYGRCMIVGVRVFPRLTPIQPV